MIYTSPWHYLAAISVAAFLIALATSGHAQEQKFKAVSVKTPDGLTISAQDWGNPNGPEILFIHGFSQIHLSWIKQVTSSDLAKEFHMVTYDLRGHGNSDKPLESERYKTSKYWGDEVQAVMDPPGLKRPVRVGWSYGGRVMADYLTTHGAAKLAGLNYVDAGQKGDPSFFGPNLRNLPLMASENLAINIAATRAFLHDCFSIQPTQEEYENHARLQHDGAAQGPPRSERAAARSRRHVAQPQASGAGDARGGGQELEPDRRRIHGEDGPRRQAFDLPGRRPLAFLRGYPALQRRTCRLRAQRPKRELTSPFHSPKATPAAALPIGGEPRAGLFRQHFLVCPFARRDRVFRVDTDIWPAACVDTYPTSCTQRLAFAGK